MNTEYIWFKRGRESKRTVDPEGKKPLTENLPNNVVAHHTYRRGEVEHTEFKKFDEVFRNIDYD